MNKPGCDFETEVLRAIRSKDWPGPLKKHLDECASCRQSALISKLLDADCSGGQMKLHPGLDAGQLWLMAEYKIRQRRARRRPWFLGGIAALAVLAAALIAVALLPAGQSIAPPAAELSAKLDHALKSPLIVVGIVLLLITLAGGEFRTNDRLSGRQSNC